MNLHPDNVSKVMNTAVTHLMEAGIPVTPYTHYARLSSWLDELEGLNHPDAIECRVLITIAMLHVNDTLNYLQEVA